MQILSISGAVAAGKTTLLNRLLTALGEGARAHEERPQDNPFIRRYYEDTRRWSFYSQVAFLSLYFDAPLPDESECAYYFYDRCLIENLVLARYRRNEGDLTREEYQILEKLARGMEIGRAHV